MHHVCHDFKSPRNDSSKRLPPIFAMVPVLFYVIMIGGAYVSVTSYVNYRNAVQTRDQWKQHQTSQDEGRARLETEKMEVTQAKLKAEKLAQWVEGTRALQPVSVAIARAMPPEISLGELSLERSAEIPQQVTLSVRINNGTLEDVGKIQSALGNLNYRCYNSQQLKTGEALDFRSMLVWQQL
jgi:hypothetical protein